MTSEGMKSKDVFPEVGLREYSVCESRTSEMEKLGDEKFKNPSESPRVSCPAVIDTQKKNMRDSNAMRIAMMRVYFGFVEREQGQLQSQVNGGLLVRE